MVGQKSGTTVRGLTTAVTLSEAKMSILLESIGVEDLRTGISEINGLFDAGRRQKSYGPGIPV